MPDESNAAATKLEAELRRQNGERAARGLEPFPHRTALATLAAERLYGEATRRGMACPSGPAHASMWTWYILEPILEAPQPCMCWADFETRKTPKLDEHLREREGLSRSTERSTGRPVERVLSRAEAAARIAAEKIAADATMMGMTIQPDVADWARIIMDPVIELTPVTTPDQWTPGQRMILWATDTDWVVLDVAGSVLGEAGRIDCGYAVDSWRPADPGMWIWEGSARQPDKIVELDGRIRRAAPAEMWCAGATGRLG